MKLLISVVQEISWAVSHAPSQSRLGLGDAVWPAGLWWTLGGGIRRSLAGGEAAVDPGIGLRKKMPLIGNTDLRADGGAN